MKPTEGQRTAAEDLRKEGNSLFQRGKYTAAAERYTEAITLWPGCAALYVNRALAVKKHGAAGAWGRVESDAASALALDPNHLKANYLLGMAMRELGGDLRQAIGHLHRALEQAREKDDAIKDEIWRELAKAQDAAWKLESAARRGEVDALRDALRALARAGPCAAAAGAKHPVPDGPAETPEGPGSGGGGGGKGALPASAGGAPAPGAVDWLALDRVFDRAARCDTRGEVPSAFTCPLTMEVYRDPVTSKSGHTYERTALTEHLTKVGGWDPITRVPMALSDVRPNIAMRNAVALYLEEHPWAWHECY